MRKRAMILMMTLVLSVVAVAADELPRIFHNYTSANGLADNSAQTIHCTKTGRIVITTIGQINFFNGSKISYIDPLEENSYNLSAYRGNYHLYFDKYHHIWLKNTNSVTCVDLMTERYVASVEDEFRKLGVDEQVNDLFVDSTGVVWLLTKSGLHNVQTQLLIRPHEKLNLQDLEVCGQRVMLFYANGLMEMYDQKTGKKTRETKAYSDTDAGLYANSSLVLRNGNKVYMLRNGGKDAILLSYDIDKNKWTELMRTPYHLNNMTIKDAQLYVPCEYGYWTLDIKTGQAQHTETLLLENNKTLKTDINVIEFDRQGGMWIGTERRGLLYSRPFRSPFYSYPWGDSKADHYGAMMAEMKPWAIFRNRIVNCVYKDSRGWTWVGTSQGLQVYRKDTDVLPQVYTKKDGLYNNVIHTIIEDDMHNIWVGASYGLSLVMFKDKRVHRIVSYNQYDHIPNEGFVNGKAMRLPDGKIIMQALDHVVEFNPADFTSLAGKYNFEIYPKLIQLLVNGVNVNFNTEMDGKKILDKALSRIWGLDLNYEQNSITMGFSALNYFRPQQTFYRVRVLGLDDEWRILAPYNSDGLVDSNGMLHLPLMSLRPGHYEVEVQASMSPDDWNTKPYVWTIDIHEPWWRTTGVFMLLAAVLLVLFLINLFYYMKNVNLRAQRNSEELGLIKRIYNFVDHCNSDTELLEPIPEEYSAAVADAQNELDPLFVRVINRIMPVVLGEKKKGKMTMRRLSSAAGVDAKDFYALITANIFKSPRPLIKKARLAKAERMLRNTKEPLEVIAKECGFVSVNYLIASFFHTYHTTPEAYRRRR